MIGAACLQTNDTLNIGTRWFLEVEKELGKYLVRKTIIELLNDDSLEFNGANVHICHSIYSIIQQFTISKLQPLSEIDNTNTSEFISQRARGAYIASTNKADLIASFAVLKNYKNPTVIDVNKLNKLIQRAKENKVKFNFCTLDLQYIRISVFMDSSFAQNLDLSSQLGFLVLSAH